VPTDAAIVTAKAAEAETCVTCHVGTTPVARSGPGHTEVYAEFYQDGIVTIDAASMNLAIAGSTTTLTFNMTENKTGTPAPFNCEDADSIGSYLTKYDGDVARTFSGYLSLKPRTTAGTGANQAVEGSIVGTAGGACTWIKDHATNSATNAATLAALGADYVVQIYGVDEILETDPAKHISSGKYPFAGVRAYGTVNYETASNVSGCENCHTQPFLKHTYIYGTVADNATGTPTEFYTCKGCHTSARTGGHEDWQILKDDPARYAEIDAGSAITAAEETKYAYKAKLMNDVHMSHAMEFAYPQSMQNCVTCHDGKMGTAAGEIFATANFNAETCVSCHSVDGIKAKMGAASYTHSGLVDNLTTTTCTTCHDGSAAPTFSTIHGGGYDSKIYTTAGVRYSDTFVVSIDSASVADNILTVNFSATGSTGSLVAADIVPTVLVGLYGYNSKDFIVAAHGRDADGNRLLEHKFGGTNPRFTEVTAAGGSWEVTVDLSGWADMFTDGRVNRAEIAVLPELKDAAGTVLGLNAPSKTFNFAANAFETYFDDIVKVAKTGTAPSITGCNTCHDQLATTFHSGIRGGNIKVCRICHEVSSRGSHLELQSRSIDSYVHAIHSFQAFDPGDIDFNDPVEALEYSHHIGTAFPRFGILNCESCHNSGMYGVPDQSKSMPGVLSGTDTVAGRNIGSIPEYVTGPATRACGGCHRAQKINADDSTGLEVLNQHFRTFGYLVENGDTVWEAVVGRVMAYFK
jgi:OmcA/MtrC family decaheme c-type cytochrome